MELRALQLHLSVKACNQNSSEHSKLLLIFLFAAFLLHRSHLSLMNGAEAFLFDMQDYEATTFRFCNSYEKIEF
jgi:hypothetical protein